MRSQEANSETSMPTATNHCKILDNCTDTYFLDTGEFPKKLADLVRQPPDFDTWQGPYLRDGKLPDAPWGQPNRYDAPDDDNHTFCIYSYGADKEPGSNGLDADISNTSQ
jgi:general secretion pathway protein G